MDKSLLSRPSLDSEATEAVDENIPYTTEKGDGANGDNTGGRDNSQKIKYLIVSVVYNIVLTATLICMFFGSRNQVKPQDQHGFTALTTFDESDLRYQSIKKDHDEVWQNLTIQRPTGIVEISEGNEVKIGGIAMFVSL